MDEYYLNWGLGEQVRTVCASMVSLRQESTGQATRAWNQDQRCELGRPDQRDWNVRHNFC